MVKELNKLHEESVENLLCNMHSVQVP